jgi:hypothetical protein
LLFVEVGLLRLENRGSFKDSGFNSVWLKVDVEIPFLDLFGFSDHPVQLFDASNSLWGFLEETLSNISHDALVFSDLGWNSDKCAKLWWQVDILTFLTNFKQWLTH